MACIVCGIAPSNLHFSKGFVMILYPCSLYYAPMFQSSLARFIVINKTNEILVSREHVLVFPSIFFIDIHVDGISRHSSMFMREYGRWWIFHLKQPFQCLINNRKLSEITKYINNLVSEFSRLSYEAAATYSKMPTNSLILTISGLPIKTENLMFTLSFLKQNSSHFFIS